MHALRLVVLGLALTACQDQPAQSTGPTPPSVQQGVSAYITVDRLNAAVSTLPKRLRTLVTLCYYDELSYRDVSETLGISRSRVCQLHAQAMRALRKSLAR